MGVGEIIESWESLLSRFREFLIGGCFLRMDGVSGAYSSLIGPREVLLIPIPAVMESRGMIYSNVHLEEFVSKIFHVACNCAADFAYARNYH